MIPAILIALLEIFICLSLAASHRLRNSVKLTALQGIALALLPFALWNWQGTLPPWTMWCAAVITCAVKAVLLPKLITRTMEQTGVKKEVEPLLNLSASLGICGAAAIILLAVTSRFTAYLYVSLLVTASLLTLFTGLLIICSRRKAITQVLGFLVLENGIAFFAAAMQLEYGIFIELGILLDLLVLVFLMGIATFKIRSEFSHIDTDRLNTLREEDDEIVEEK